MQNDFNENEAGRSERKSNVTHNYLFVYSYEKCYTIGIHTFKCYVDYILKVYTGDIYPIF